ncbi:MAG: HD domain-containing protein [Patescibacteria group bacterium]|nr:HD domain-containing protein [Patescibacteria group bacterium]
MDRTAAIALLEKNVLNENLRRHMYAVEAAMRKYAMHFKQDPVRWGIIGLLHDVDYERFPSPKDHPFKAAEMLRNAGCDEDFVQTVLAHAPHTNSKRDTLAKKAIYSIDELTGFIVAVALVKPHKSLAEVDFRSIRKKMKDKAFARQINRDEITLGAQELGVPLQNHIETVLGAMKDISRTLGL